MPALVMLVALSPFCWKLPVPLPPLEPPPPLTLAWVALYSASLTMSFHCRLPVRK